MKCSCGGEMKGKYKEIVGIRTKVSVCPDCGKELLDTNQAINMQKKVKDYKAIFGILKNKKIKYTQDEHEETTGR